MKKIFIGLLLVLFDFTLSFDTHVLGLLPDFIGYLLIVLGLKELLQLWNSPAFTLARSLGIAATVLSAISYLWDLLGITFGWFSVGWGVLCTVLFLVISYQLVLGVQDIEAQSALNLESGKLRARWLPMAILQAAAWFTLWVELLYIVLLVLMLVFAVLFLIAFQRSMQQYEGGVQ